ncbi:MAG: hypothetical protein KDB88_07130 [Flavobacteriales bacterium]|nr:hypothetical protein [Flavobacteriales bacterium]
MYRRILLSALALSALVATVWWQQERPRSSDLPMGMGAADDPNGLRMWQQQRLQDPASGVIPPNIRRKELEFARTLPVRATAKSLSWTWRGPRNRGGRTRAMEVDRSNSQILLAGGVTGGMWRSTDAGTSWTRTSPLDAMTGVSCLTQDPRSGQETTWYFGTGENYGVQSGTSFSALLPGDGIYKSTDGGQSWLQLPSTIAGDHENFERNFSFKQVNGIAVDPTRNDSDIVLAAVYNGVFRSNDGGGSWKPVLGLDTTVSNTSTYSELRMSSTGVCYAALGNNGPAEGLWRSEDGLTWVNITPTGFPGNKERTVLAIDPSNESVVYWFSQTPASGTQGHSFWKYTYLSGDGSGAGGEWENRSSNLPNGTCTGYFNFDFGYINSQSSYDMCVTVHPTDPNVVYIGGTNLYRSDDAFATDANTAWIGGYRCNLQDPKDYVYPAHHPDQHWVTFDPADPTIMYSANDGGVQRTNDPLADSVIWVDLNTTYITSQFYTVHLEDGPTDDPRLIGGLQDNGTFLATSADPADDWKVVHQDDGAYAAIPQGANFILASSQRGRLYKKPIDAQGNVLGFERIDPMSANSSYNFINQFVLDPADNNKLYWVSNYTIWRNNDLAGINVTDNFYDANDQNWEELTGAQLPTLQRITCLDISLARSNTLFYGTTVSRLWRCDSLDTNPVKTNISDPLWPQGAYISCIAPNDFNPDEWLMTFSNYGIKSIWHTLDGGTSWTSVSGNLEEFADGSGSGPAVFWALIYPTWDGADDRYFVATSTGVYSTDLLDGDNTIWVQEGLTSIGNVPVNMIAARNHDGLIAVATHGNGIYSSFLEAAPVGLAEGNLARTARVWPNPTNASVTMDLSSMQGPALVRIMDLRGRSVRQERVSGDRFQWDLQDGQARRVRYGTYLIHVSDAAGHSFIERVVVQ